MPERTRVDQGIVEVERLVDAQRLDEAALAIEKIKGWDLESNEFDDRLKQLLQRIAELRSRAEDR